MIELQSQAHDRILWITMAGKLTADDYRQLVPALERAVQAAPERR
jgi:hypothetical protein